MHTRAQITRSARSRGAFQVPEAGFTLIEVLVAILVLSFGMLGVVGLQAAAMQANKDARFQSSAVRLGREYAEMMRTNKAVAGVAGNVYLSPSTAVPTVNCFTGTCGNDTSAITTERTKVARWEIAEWYARAAAELPGLRVDVCFDTQPYDSAGRPVWACTAPATVQRGSPAYIKMGWTVMNRNEAAASAVTLAGAGRPMVIVPAQMN